MSKYLINPYHEKTFHIMHPSCHNLRLISGRVSLWSWAWHAPAGFPQSPVPWPSEARMGCARPAAPNFLLRNGVKHGTEGAGSGRRWLGPSWPSSVHPSWSIYVPGLAGWYSISHGWGRLGHRVRRRWPLLTLGRPSRGMLEEVNQVRLETMYLKRNSQRPSREKSRRLDLLV